MLDENGSFLVKLFCIDTSTAIQECLNKGNSTVFFSATLLPVTYYQSLLSQAKDDYAVYAKTHPPARTAVLIGRDAGSAISLGSQEYERIAGLHQEDSFRLREIIWYYKHGPYRMMEDVGAVFEERCGTAFRTRYQKSGMTEDEREEFLKAFEGKGEQSLIGFCVMGGIFGEGPSLKGERLIRCCHCRYRASPGLWSGSFERL